MGSLESQVRRALDTGFERLGVLSPLYEADVEALLSLIPAGSVSSIELFQPLPREIRPGRPSPFRLGSPSAEDKRDAVLWGRNTIRFAERHGIPVVCVPPTGLDPELRGGHRRYLEGPRLPVLRGSLRAARNASLGRRPFDAFLSVLAKLLETAADAGVSVALTPGGWIDEVPDAREVSACAREFAGAPMGLWLDTANLALCEDAHAEGGDPDSSRRDPELPESSQPVLGITIRDVEESGEPAFPGEGIVDWGRVAAPLAASPVWLVAPPGGSWTPRIEEAAAFVDGLAPRKDYDPFRRT